MRISDWSSDVCSSDLPGPAARMPQADHPESAIQTALESFVKIDLDSKDFVLGVAGAGAMGRGIAQVAVAGGMRVRLYDAFPKASAEAARSEEHTSELQSLMRNSYAVFCLKKKTKEKNR